MSFLFFKTVFAYIDCVTRIDFSPLDIMLQDTKDENRDCYHLKTFNQSILKEVDQHLRNSIIHVFCETILLFYVCSMFLLKIALGKTSSRWIGNLQHIHTWKSLVLEEHLTICILVTRSY